MKNVRNKNQKITEFLPDFKILMLYTVTIDFSERLNCNDLSNTGGKVLSKPYFDNFGK